LFDQCGKVDRQLFQGSFAARQNGFFSAENCVVQNTSKKPVHGLVGTRCEPAGPSVGKMRS
jgi:hypothetical protein